MSEVLQRQAGRDWGRLGQMRGENVTPSIRGAPLIQGENSSTLKGQCSGRFCSACALNSKRFTLREYVHPFVLGYGVQLRLGPYDLVCAGLGNLPRVYLERVVQATLPCFLNQRCYVATYGPAGEGLARSRASAMKLTCRRWSREISERSAGLLVKSA